ncbi:hypothetical protein AGMMS50293_03270 [Spirochaetia bacterium]|nr:hypothetical protein AGMMS50293_03270 [Spirochaetia bacterium]
MEKVFIAWGGNQPLAKLVGEEMQKYGYDGIVGGGTPTDTFIGTQIFSQINQCAHAVILVEKTQGGAFSGNLMFEWGYLTAKIAPRKLHVFLIGETTKSLPSDLAGVWADEISGDGRAVAEIAAEIASKFFKDASRPVDIPKIEIFGHWNETKRQINSYNNSPLCSEIELAHYLLHSIEVTYYYMEEGELLSLINKITPASNVLEFAIQVVKANIALFEESPGLTKPLSFDTFTELKSVFDTKFDFLNQDENLDLWLKYFCFNRLSILYMLIARNDEFDLEYKKLYFEKSLEYNDTALSILKNIAEKYPQESVYTKLYESYYHRDCYKAYKLIGNIEKASVSIIAAAKAREAFYINFKQRFPNDKYLIKRFGEEYYLACAEQLEFVNDPLEKKILESTIRSFIDKSENESGRQHVVLQQLRSRFSDKNE